jgi:hypothetical protein
VKIIQIAVQSGEDGELYGLSDDGQLYAYRYPRAPFKSERRSATDGFTGGWEPLKCGLNEIIPYVEPKAATPSDPIIAKELNGGEIFELSEWGFVRLWGWNRSSQGRMAEIMLSNGELRQLTTEQLQRQLDEAMAKRANAAEVAIGASL